MRPLPTQISGAAFLAQRRFALLADQPRVGKTGAAIMACDMALDASILVVTTASGRPVWRKAWADWSAAGRSDWPCSMRSGATVTNASRKVLRRGALA